MLLGAAKARRRLFSAFASFLFNKVPRFMIQKICRRQYPKRDERDSKSVESVVLQTSPVCDN